MPVGLGVDPGALLAGFCCICCTAMVSIVMLSIGIWLRVDKCDRLPNYNWQLCNTTYYSLQETAKGADGYVGFMLNNVSYPVQLEFSCNDISTYNVCILKYNTLYNSGVRWACTIINEGDRPVSTTPAINNKKDCDASTALMVIGGILLTFLIFLFCICIIKK